MFGVEISPNLLIIITQEVSTIYERGLAEQERLFDSTSGPVIHSLENLGKTYESHGFLKEAESIYSDIINR